VSVSDIIAIASVCVAVLALVLSWRASRKALKASREANEVAKQQVALQARMTRIEESREHARLMRSLQAMIRAELRETDHNSWRLFVMNTGEATARNVTIRLDDRPILDHPAIPGGQQEVKTVGPHSEISYSMAIRMGSYPPFKLEATWDHDSGEQGHYGTTLTL